MSVSRGLASTWVSPVTLSPEVQRSPADSPGTRAVPGVSGVRAGEERMLNLL